MRAFAIAGLGLALAACQPTGDVGYVEIKAVPSFTNVAQPRLYLDSLQVGSLRKGSAILTHRVGTTRLATEGAGGQLTLCEIVVKKNRITTVTVSVLERPPRCHCRNGGGASRICVS